MSKKLSSEQREDLLRALNTRFEKNMGRHKGLEWVKVQKKLDVNAEKLWLLNEMESSGGEPDVVGADKKSGEYFFMIVRRKILMAAEVFVTTLKRWNQGKNIHRKIALWIWRLSWALKFYRKSNTGICRNLESSIRKHQAG